MKYKDYKSINENFFNLGLKTPRSIGAVGSKLAEMGLQGPPMGDPSAEDDVPEEDDGGGMDGMDLSALAGADDGGDAGPMGGPDLGDDGMDGAAGPDPMGGGDVDLSSLGIDPQLLALLSMAGLNPDMLSQLGGGMSGMMGGNNGGADLGADLGGDAGGDDEGGAVVPAEKGKNPFEKGSPFGDKADADDSADDSDDSEDDEDEMDDADAEEESSVKNPFAKGDSDDSDDSDDEDDSEDDDDSDDEEKGPPPKFMNSGAKDKCCKYMKKEDVDFFNSLTGMGRGNVRKTFSSGMPKKMREEALLEPEEQAAPKKSKDPQPGEVGYAPNGRVGSNFEVKSFSEWLAAKRANVNE